MRKILTATIALLMVLLTGCDEPLVKGLFDEQTDRKMPEISTFGANIFACRINGEIWVPGAECGWGHNEDLTFTDHLWLREGIDTIYSFAGKDFCAAGGILRISLAFDINGSIAKPEYISIRAYDREENKSFIDRKLEGDEIKDVFTELNIRYIGNSKIIYGQFNFDFIELETGILHEVREGRFDVEI